HAIRNIFRAVRAAIINKNLGEERSASRDAALHGADGAVGDLGGCLVREAAGAHQKQGLSLPRGQASEYALEVLEVEMLLLAAARGRLVLVRDCRHRRHPAAPPDYVEKRIPQ